MKTQDLGPKTYDLKPIILLGLTTTPGSDWREKIREIDDLGIKEIAFFPTYLKPDERKELYDLLKKSSLEKIIFTHLREDMTEEEIACLQNKYSCNLFNIHPNKLGLAAANRMDQFKKLTYLENLRDNILEIKENVATFAGLCIDFSHWEDSRLRGEKNYDPFSKLVEKNEVGLCHISAIRNEPTYVKWDAEHLLHYSMHSMEKLSELDYLKKYINYLPDILGLELENSFKEQLEAKKYLEEMINE